MASGGVCAVVEETQGRVAIERVTVGRVSIAGIRTIDNGEMKGE